MDAIDRVIQLAQQAASGPVSMRELQSATAAAYDAAAAPEESVRETASSPIAVAVFSAASAANAGTAAENSATPAGVSHAAGASRNAYLALRDAGVIVGSNVIRRDFELVKLFAEREKWTDETPVPPEFFGPLWPDGQPEGWPVESGSATFKGKPMFPDDEAALRLHFAIPAEMDREEADRIIQDIIVAANELHLAYGGSGLTIADRIRIYEPALVPVGGDE